MKQRQSSPWPFIHDASSTINKPSPFVLKRWKIKENKFDVFYPSMFFVLFHCQVLSLFHALARTWEWYVLTWPPFLYAMRQLEGKQLATKVRKSVIPYGRKDETVMTFPRASSDSIFRSFLSVTQLADTITDQGGGVCCAFFIPFLLLFFTLKGENPWP